MPAADLHKLEAQLANYIGPIARVLIARSAGAASGIDDLLARLAAELDSSDDQNRFLDACQWLHRPPRVSKLIPRCGVLLEKPARCTRTTQKRCPVGARITTGARSMHLSTVAPSFSTRHFGGYVVCFDV